MRYLEEHHFPTVPDYQQLEEQADRALTALTEARLNGRSITDAVAIADEILFENIGESEYEIVREILMEYFNDTVDLSDDQWVEYWVKSILEEVTHLFDDCEQLTFGVSAADLDIHRDEIIGKITNYFEARGFYGV